MTNSRIWQPQIIRKDNSLPVPPNKCINIMWMIKITRKLFEILPNRTSVSFVGLNCDQCGKSYSKKTSLNAHKSKDCVNKTFQLKCAFESCKYKSSRKSNLKVHLCRKHNIVGQAIDSYYFIVDGQS